MKNGTAALNEANQSFITILSKEKTGIELHLANSIWLNEVYHFERPFIENTEEFYHADISEVDISDPQTAEVMNQWVVNQTN